MSPTTLFARARSRRRSLPLLATVTAAALALAGCGGDDDSAEAGTLPPAGTSAPATGASSTPVSDPPGDDGAPADTAPAGPATTAPVDLSGVTIRVGDQAQQLELPLRLSGEFDDIPYELEFASFASGPLVNEAFAAGAIDIGTMGDTPALLSFAQGLDTVVVGIRSSNGLSMSLVASPESGITSLDDIAGARVAYTTGSNQHGFVLRALDSIGLSEDDIEHIDVPLAEVTNVLAENQADVAVLYELARPAYDSEQPDAVDLASLNDFTNSYNYLLSQRSVLDEPARAAALEDLVGRLARAAKWVEAHPDEWIQAFYVDVQKQTFENGKTASEAQGRTEWVEIAGGDAQASQQTQADLFHAAGLFPEPVDVSPQYDPALTDRFSRAIAAAFG